MAGYTGRYALADDSGLEVDALNGAPGVYSARYAGAEPDDKRNLAKLLEELKGVPPDKRTARFHAVIALAAPGGRIVGTFDGTVEGAIGEAPKGESGFGYDPVFYPRGHGRTFAQMAPGEKDSMSHRARALALLSGFLKKER